MAGAFSQAAKREGGGEECEAHERVPFDATLDPNSGAKMTRTAVRWSELQCDAGFT